MWRSMGMHLNRAVVSTRRIPLKKVYSMRFRDRSCWAKPYDAGKQLEPGQAKGAPQ
jgi:hypothetical protein